MKITTYFVTEDLVNLAVSFPLISVYMRLAERPPESSEIEHPYSDIFIPTGRDREQHWGRFLCTSKVKSPWPLVCRKLY
jgi:hypothetical protein